MIHLYMKPKDDLLKKWQILLHLWNTKCYYRQWTWFHEVWKLEGGHNFNVIIKNKNNFIFKLSDELVNHCIFWTRTCGKKFVISYIGIAVISTCMKIIIYRFYNIRSQSVTLYHFHGNWIWRTFIYYIMMSQQMNPFYGIQYVRYT